MEEVHFGNETLKGSSSQLLLVEEEALLIGEMMKGREELRAQG